jgi:uncharacterized repeat protein (TIGR03803 family)
MRHASLLFLVCFTMAVGSLAQTFTKLADFDGTNGSDPTASLVQAIDGNFYGTTSGGGSNNNCTGGCGTVFKITPEGTLTTLYSFCPQNGCADGAGPAAGLVQGADGDLYGTTEEGGANDYGTVFKITLQGMPTTIYSFCSQDGCADGGLPAAGLVQGTDGNLYGTTAGGGAAGYGTVFKITAEGSLTTLYSFDRMDGFDSFSALVQGADGNFYGTTYAGGANNKGTVFKMTPQGALTTLYAFCPQPGCTDGSSPSAGVVQGTDGNFYGTTQGGGADREGTVYKVTPQGTLTTLHYFVVTDGAFPDAGLVQGTDGNFYGTTAGGGANGGGTVFEITPEGTLTTLHSFTFEGAEGSGPVGGVVLGTDGNFFGTTAVGGTSNNCSGGCGTVFRLDTGLFDALSVAKNGNGIVAGNDGHIYCGFVCAYPYPKGIQVTLSSVPSPGYTFSGWTGCDNVNGYYCSVTMNSAKNVTAAFDVANITLTSLTFKPTYVQGGQLSAGTLTLNAAAPPGGVSVALSSDNPDVAHVPSFVFVPGGKSSMQFAVYTLPVKSNTTVTITATAGSSHVSGALMVGTSLFPPSLR